MNYSKGTSITELARRYLTHTAVQELLTHFNITCHEDAVTYQIWLVIEIKRMKTTPGLSPIKDKKKMKREKVEKELKKLFKRVKQTYVKKEIVKREQVERKPDTKGKGADFSDSGEDSSKTETILEVFAIIYSKTIWLIWIKELSERESPDLSSTPELFNQICKQDISQVDTVSEE